MPAVADLGLRPHQPLRHASAPGRGRRAAISGVVSPPSVRSVSATAGLRRERRVAAGEDQPQAVVAGPTGMSSSREEASRGRVDRGALRSARSANSRSPDPSMARCGPPPEPGAGLRSGFRRRPALRGPRDASGSASSASSKSPARGSSSRAPVRAPRGRPARPRAARRCGFPALSRLSTIGPHLDFAALRARDPRGAPLRLGEAPRRRPGRTRRGARFASAKGPSVTSRWSSRTPHGRRRRDVLEGGGGPEPATLLEPRRIGAVLGHHRRPVVGRHRRRGSGSS